MTQPELGQGGMNGTGTAGDQPWRCLCLGVTQITITRPWRRITRHLSHIFLTEARTFIGVWSPVSQTATLSHQSSRAASMRWVMASISPAASTRHSKPRVA